MQTVGDVLVALLVYGGGPTAIAYGVFRYLGEKWIESKFSAQLEAERHEHAKELQGLKKKLDSELSRIVKLQDREFTVLAEAWELLQDALGEVSSLVSIVRQSPDLSRLSPERLEEFLSGSRLTEVHRSEVRAAPDKTKYYQDLIFWYDLNDAKRIWWKYRSYINKNSIFLRPQLSEAFQKINGVIWDALVSREIGEESKDIKFWVEASRKMREQTEPLMKELHERVRAVLEGKDGSPPAL